MTKKIAFGAPAPGSVMEGFRNAMMTPTFLAMMAAPLIAAGGGAIERRVRAGNDAKARTLAYRQMMDLHPHFKERDPADISRIYQSLSNVSPIMARDPLVAGAWVDNIIENRSPGMNSHQALLVAVKDLAGIQRSVADTQMGMRATPTTDAANAWVDRAARGMDTAIDKNIHKTFGEASEAHRQSTQRDIKLVKKERKKFERAIGTLQGLTELDKESSAHTPLADLLRALKV